MAKQPQISKFLNSFKKTELARPCNFDVIITPSIFSVAQNVVGASVPGKIFMTKLFKEGEKFRTKCMATSLPERGFGLADAITYGPTNKFPIQHSLGQISLEIICSDDMSEKKFFDTWLEIISPMNELTPLVGLADELLEASSLGIDIGVGVRYDFSYKDDYACEVEINQYDLKGEKSYTVVLKEAFPYFVGSLPLNWGNSSDFHRFSVNFAYKYFTTK